MRDGERFLRAVATRAVAVVTAGTPFALGTFEVGDGRAFVGLVLGDRVAELGALLAPGTTIRTLLEEWDANLPRLQGLADRSDTRASAEYNLGELRPLPPVLPAGQLFQAGANYRTHVMELMAAAAERQDASDGLGPEHRLQMQEALDERGRTGTPFVFLGLPHAVAGARDDVVLPAGDQQHDWELELAAVIGRRARHVPRERALEVVAGYTICNDITMRDRLARPDVPGVGLDWLAAKNSPTFFPTGPLLVPSVHAGDPMDLRITLRLNGRTMQDSSTSDMLIDIPRIIEHASSVAELRPGDLVLTGSPAGNGAHHGRFLRPGDVMEAEITGLGGQRNVCVAERVAAAR